MLRPVGFGLAPKVCKRARGEAECLHGMNGYPVNPVFCEPLIRMFGTSAMKWLLRHLHLKHHIRAAHFRCGQSCRWPPESSTVASWKRCSQRRCGVTTLILCLSKHQVATCATPVTVLSQDGIHIFVLAGRLLASPSWRKPHFPGHMTKQ